MSNQPVVETRMASSALCHTEHISHPFKMAHIKGFTQHLEFSCPDYFYIMMLLSKCHYPVIEVLKLSKILGVPTTL